MKEAPPAAYFLKKFHSLKSRDVIELFNLINDLGWDFDRMSSSGQETYEKICLKLGMWSSSSVEDIEMNKE